MAEQIVIQNNTVSSDVIVSVDVTETEIIINTISDVAAPPGGDGVSPIRLSTTKSVSVTATALDATRVVKLNGATAPVDYTIDPVLWSGLTVPIICIDATNRVRLLPLTGLINKQTEVEFGELDSGSIWSDGTNLFILK